MSRVSVVQMRASADKERNLRHILRCVGSAARRGSSLCAFPEFMMAAFPGTKPELAGLAEPLRGPFVSEISRAAREHRIEVVGTLYESARSGVYDTSFLVSASGRLASWYRKTHLYDALGSRESSRLSAGARLPRPAPSSLGKLGMLVCYDLRFPEVSRSLASSGARVLVAPSAWASGPMKKEHWRVMNRARALENGCYVVSPNQTGPGYCGLSCVVDPFGRTVLEMGSRPGARTAEVSMESVRRVRRSLPLLRGRRTDLYR